MNPIRFWKSADISEIENHILIIDEQLGFCPGCKSIGIKLDDISRCPGCRREIKYLTIRDANGNKGHEIITRLMSKISDKEFVDYSDYERITRKNRAHDLFSGI